MKRLSVALSLMATPALAAEGPFFTLRNAEFVVTIAFLVFVGLVLYLKVPGRLAGMLDNRAKAISAELAEAKALRDEARALLASYESKQKEVLEQSARIIASAREEAQAAATQAKADLQQSITRRLAAAGEQIDSAVKSAERAVRERAIAVSIAAAGDVLAKQMTAQGAAASIDAAIAQVEAKLH